MPRSSVRVGLAQLLSGLQDTAGNPLFASVWDRKPPRVDRTQFAACIVMIPESDNVRTATRQKHDLFGCQLRIAHALPSQSWSSQGTGAGANIYYAPATDPQVIFDDLIDQLVDGLMVNQEFKQDVPSDPNVSRQVIELGQKITVRATEPEKRGEAVTLAAIVEFTVREQILGV